MTFPSKSATSEYFMNHQIRASAYLIPFNFFHLYQILAFTKRLLQNLEIPVFPLSPLDSQKT